MTTSLTDESDDPSPDCPGTTPDCGPLRRGGIIEALAIFAGRNAPLLTGFALRSIGSRRFGDQTIYRHDKAPDRASAAD